MISVLGMHRVMILLALLALCVLLAAGTYLYALPQEESLERDLRVVRAQIIKKQSEVTDMRDRFDELKDEQILFNGLKNAGMFNEQNRVWALKTMNEFQKLSNVLNAEFRFEPVAVTEKEALRETDYIVLDGKVSVEIEAMDDLDIYNYIYWLENAFPGHTSVSHMELKRVQDVNEVILRSIGNGQKRVMVSADLDFSWKTLSSRGTVFGDDAVQPGGL